MKRVLDILVAVTLLVVLFPVLLVISTLIKIDSKGPVFFRQQRIGQFGKPFRIIKFRSMTAAPQAEKGRFDAGSEVRVTRIGRILRKSKLDEVPQLLNVLKGEMSLVGPRPEVEKWVNAYPQRWRCIHTAKPGITDPASIEFRNEEELLKASTDPEQTYRDEILLQKLALYEQYIQNRSFWVDLKLLFQTFAKVTRG